MLPENWIQERNWVITQDLTSLEIQYLIILCQSANIYNHDTIADIYRIGQEHSGKKVYIGGIRAIGTDSPTSGPSYGVQLGAEETDIIVTYNEFIEAAKELIKSNL